MVTNILSFLSASANIAGALNSPVVERLNEGSTEQTLVTKPLFLFRVGAEPQDARTQVRTLLALTAATRAEPDENARKPLDNLYQFYARRLIDAGAVQPGPHLLFPKVRGSAGVGSDARRGDRRDARPIP